MMTREELHKEFEALCNEAIDLLVIFRIYNDLFKFDNLEILKNQQGGSSGVSKA